MATKIANPSLDSLLSLTAIHIIDLVLCNFMTIYLDSDLLTRFLNTISVVLKL